MRRSRALRQGATRDRLSNPYESEGPRMSEDQYEPDHNAEIVPLHPDGPPAALPAVPGEHWHRAGTRPGHLRRTSPAYPASGCRSSRRRCGAGRTSAPRSRWSAASSGTGPAITGCAPRCTWWPCWSWAVVGVVRIVGPAAPWWWVLEQHRCAPRPSSTGTPASGCGCTRRPRRPGRSAAWSCSARSSPLAVAAAVLAGYAPWWTWRRGWRVAAVLFLAGPGRPAGHRIIGTAIVPPDYSPPTHAIITARSARWASRRSTRR